MTEERRIGRLAVLVSAARFICMFGLVAIAAGIAFALAGFKTIALIVLGATLALVSAIIVVLAGRIVASAGRRLAAKAETTIYMPLLGEGIDVYRPVEAMKIDDLGYMVTEPMPPEEEWAFPPGHILTCEERELADGRKLVAKARYTGAD